MMTSKMKYTSAVEMRINNKLHDMVARGQLAQAQIDKYQPEFTVVCKFGALAHIYEIEFSAVIDGDRVSTEFEFGHRAGIELPDLSEIDVIVESALLRLGNTIREVG